MDRKVAGKASYRQNENCPKKKSGIPVPVRTGSQAGRKALAAVTGFQQNIALSSARSHPPPSGKERGESTISLPSAKTHIQQNIALSSTWQKPASSGLQTENIALSSGVNRPMSAQQTGESSFNRHSEQTQIQQNRVLGIVRPTAGQQTQNVGLSRGVHRPTTAIGQQTQNVGLSRGVHRPTTAIGQHTQSQSMALSSTEHRPAPEQQIQNTASAGAKPLFQHDAPERTSTQGNSKSVTASASSDVLFSSSVSRTTVSMLPASDTKASSHRMLSLVEEQQQSGVEFQQDSGALQSILSNRGITALPASSMFMPQRVTEGQGRPVYIPAKHTPRSSAYAAAGRMSLMDSCNEYLRFLRQSRGLEAQSECASPMMKKALKGPGSLYPQWSLHKLRSPGGPLSGQGPVEEGVPGMPKTPRMTFGRVPVTVTPLSKRRGCGAVMTTTPATPTSTSYGRVAITPHTPNLRNSAYAAVGRMSLMDSYNEYKRFLQQSRGLEAQSESASPMVSKGPLQKSVVSESPLTHLTATKTQKGQGSLYPKWSQRRLPSPSPGGRPSGQQEEGRERGTPKTPLMTFGRVPITPKTSKHGRILTATPTTPASECGRAANTPSTQRGDHVKKRLRWADILSSCSPESGPSGDGDDNTDGSTALHTVTEEDSEQRESSSHTLPMTLGSSSSSQPSSHMKTVPHSIASQAHPIPAPQDNRATEQSSHTLSLAEESSSSSSQPSSHMNTVPHSIASQAQPIAAPQDNSETQPSSHTLSLTSGQSGPSWQFSTNTVPHSRAEAPGLASIPSSGGISRPWLSSSFGGYTLPLSSAVERPSSSQPSTDRNTGLYSTAKAPAAAFVPSSGEHSKPCLSSCDSHTRPSASNRPSSSQPSAHTTADLHSTAQAPVAAFVASSGGHSRPYFSSSFSGGLSMPLGTVGEKAQGQGVDYDDGEVRLREDVAQNFGFRDVREREAYRENVPLDFGSSYVREDVVHRTFAAVDFRSRACTFSEIEAYKNMALDNGSSAASKAVEGGGGDDVRFREVASENSGSIYVREDRAYRSTAAVDFGSRDVNQARTYRQTAGEVWGTSVAAGDDDDAGDGDDDAGDGDTSQNDILKDLQILQQKEQGIRQEMELLKASVQGEQQTHSMACFVPHASLASPWASDLHTLPLTAVLQARAVTKMSLVANPVPQNRLDRVSQNSLASPISQASLDDPISQTSLARPVPKTTLANPVSQTSLSNSVPQTRSARPDTETSLANLVSQNSLANPVLPQNSQVKHINQTSLANPVSQSRLTRPASQVKQASQWTSDEHHRTLPVVCELPLDEEEVEVTSAFINSVLKGPCFQLPQNSVDCEEESTSYFQQSVRKASCSLLPQKSEDREESTSNSMSVNSVLKGPCFQLPHESVNCEEDSTSFLQPVSPTIPSLHSLESSLEDWKEFADEDSYDSLSVAGEDEAQTRQFDSDNSKPAFVMKKAEHGSEYDEMRSCSQGEWFGDEVSGESLYAAVKDGVKTEHYDCGNSQNPKSAFCLSSEHEEPLTKKLKGTLSEVARPEPEQHGHCCETEPHESATTPVQRQYVNMNDKKSECGSIQSTETTPGARRMRYQPNSTLDTVTRSAHKRRFPRETPLIVQPVALSPRVSYSRTNTHQQPTNSLQFTPPIWTRLALQSAAQRCAQSPSALHQGPQPQSSVSTSNRHYSQSRSSASTSNRHDPFLPLTSTTTQDDVVKNLRFDFSESDKKPQNNWTFSAKENRSIFSHTTPKPDTSFSGRFEQDRTTSRAGCVSFDEDPETKTIRSAFRPTTPNFSGRCLLPRFEENSATSKAGFESFEDRHAENRAMSGRSEQGGLSQGMTLPAILCQQPDVLEEALVDEECMLLCADRGHWGRESRSACDRHHCQDPVADILTYGDSMHFLPISDDEEEYSPFTHHRCVAPVANSAFVAYVTA